MATTDALAALDQIAKRALAEPQADKIAKGTRTRMVMSADGTTTFFASQLMQLDLSQNWDIPTACTDGRQLAYNPEYLMTLTSAEAVGLFAHETLHNTNKHFARRNGRDPEDWNKACDLTINPTLRNAGFTLPPGALFPGIGEYADFPDGLAPEEYYRLIQDKKRQNQQSDSGDQGDDGQSADSGDQGAPSDFGSVTEPKSADGKTVDQAELTQLDHEWSAKVAAAKMVSSARGTLPADIERMISAALAPANDWKTELRSYLNSTSRSAYNWRRPNRRMLQHDIYLPSLHNPEISHLIVAIDMSGSTSNYVDRFYSEVADMAASGLIQRMTILWHDCAIASAQEWTRDDGELELKPRGSGGTCHRCVFDWIEENQETAAALICLTDLYSSFPDDAPDYPVVWVATPNAPAEPFGERIDLPAE